MRNRPPVRPRLGEVAAAGATLAAGAATVAWAPPDAVAAGRAVGWLVLGAGFCVAAAVVRRHDTAVVRRHHTAMARRHHSPGRRCATLMTVLGVVLLVGAVEEAASAGVGDLAVLAAASRGPGALVLALVAAALALTFPSGRLEGAADRVGAGLLAAAGIVVAAVPAPAVVVTGVIALALTTAATVWLRFERSTGDDRVRLLWLVYAVGAVVVVDGHLLLLVDRVQDGPVLEVVTGLVALVGLVLPAALAVALVAPRAVDLRATISTTVLAVVMVDLVLALVSGSLAVLEGLLGHPPPRLGAALVALAAAVGFGPVRRRVRAALDQVLFGGHPDPVGMVATLGDELRRGGDPQSWLDAVRTAVDLPYAELIHGDRRLAVSGTVTGPTTTIELHAGREHVGDLVVGVSGHHTEPSRATVGVLELAAAPLARALQSTRLAEELQRSRQRVVLASEEERRRLRRDLHDGLGPVLSGVAYTADAARNLLDDRPDRASELLGELRDDVTGAIAEVRRLVQDLRPAALDQLGLVPALRQQASRLHRPDGVAVRVSIDAEALGTLPAAVEVAAYRLVSEAMLNVARHADTTSAAVRVAVRDGVLELCVRDDAVGGQPWNPGVGLTSMRERIEQLGGRLEVGGTPEGGRVRALVPVA